MKQLVTNPLERLRVSRMIRKIKHRLAFDYFGNAEEAQNGVQELEKVRRQFMGDFNNLKLSKAGGYYYYDLNTPGFPSKIFDHYYISELNRIYKKYPPKELKILLLAITKKCGLNCEHCYEWDRLNGHEVLTNELLYRTVEKFQENAVFQVQLGGGEPMLRLDTIRELVTRFKDRSDFMVVTSGYKVTDEQVRQLAEWGIRGMTVSIDHFEAEKHDVFRGKDRSFDWAARTAKSAVKHGLITGLSLCVTREFLGEENLQRYAELAADLGVGFIQIMEPRSAGAYKEKDVELIKEEKKVLSEFYEKMNFTRKGRKYPIITYHGYHQNRVGCVGAGGRFLYIDSDGDLKVCPFCDGSFGNITQFEIKDTVSEMKKTGCGIYQLSEV